MTAATTRWVASFPSPPRGVWHLGPLPIRAYALCIIAGIVVALLIGDRRWVARGGQRGVIYDIALWAVPFGLIGGRLYHLATDWEKYFGPNGAGFVAALRIWDGGLGIWGAVALGGVGAWIGCRRRGIPLPAFADAIAPGIILAQAIGRLGNYFNQELYGRETTLPWGLEIFCRGDAGFDKICDGRTSIPSSVHSLDGVSTGVQAYVVHPTFLYELIWNVLVFAALIYLDRRFTLSHGRLFAVYVALYCAGRFWIELLRADDATLIAGIRINSFTSTFVFIAAMVYVILATKGREDPGTLRGSAFVAEEAPEPEPAPELATARTDTAMTVAAAAGPREDDQTVESVEVAESTAEAEVVEPEVATTEAVAAEVAETEAAPQVVDAEAAEPEAAAPLDTEPTVAEPEAVGWLGRLRSRRRKAQSPEVPTPEVVEPEFAEAEVEQHEGAEPEAAEAEAAVSEGAEREEVEAEVEQPETAEPEAAEAEAAVSEGAESEDVEAEVEQLEAAEPEAAEAEAAVSETPDSEAESEDVESEVAPESEVAEVVAPESEAVESEAAEQSELEEPKGAEAEVESEGVETAPDEHDSPSEPDVAAEAEPEKEQEAAEEEDQTPIPLVTPGGTGSPRERWRQRLRNLRSRSGR